MTLKLGGPPDEVHCARIDEYMLDREVGKFLASQPRDDVAPQAGGHEHVGLVDQRQLAAPRARDAGGEPHDALDLGRRIDARVERPVAVPPLWAEVQPTGELTHDQNVDAGESVRTDRRRGHEGGLHRDRSKIRVQLEPFPKPEQSHLWSLDRIGIIPLRPTDGTEQNGVRRLGDGQRVDRQRDTAGIERRAAD